jgi:peptidoglycan/xylan/chitin deacetylase (PgdA/CDA1 family)
MAAVGTVYLMYHELQIPGREPCQKEGSYTRYVISESDFRAQISWLKEHEWRALSVGEALEDSDLGERRIVITFDDGCETDLIAAAPLLKEAHFNATFYVAAGFVGRPRFLSMSQIRELSDLNFEIGCHSMTHPWMSELTSEQLHFEVVEAKDRLEQIIGRPVNHFSCPGGRWDRRIADFARKAGYHSVATSYIGTNSSRSDRFRLARVPVRRGTALAAFERFCCARGLRKLSARSAGLSFIRSLLGDSTYIRFRSAVLDRSRDSGAF